MQVKLTDKAKELQKVLGVSFLPTRQSKGDAGYDLRACIETPIKVYPRQIEKIPTGVHVWLGDIDIEVRHLISFCGFYLPRSGTKGLQLANSIGLLDSSYQGESFLKVINVSEAPIYIEPGERIAQLVIQACFIAPLEEVLDFDIETGRGEGDGSSGRI